MITFTQDAKDQFSAPGCDPALQIVITLPTVGATDVTPWLVHPVGQIVSRVNPVARSMEMSQFVFSLDNADGYWSPLRSDSLLYGLNYVGSLVTVKAGVRLPSGMTELVTIFGGVLDYVAPDARSQTAEFKVVDGLEPLKNCGVGDNEGKSLSPYDTTERYDDCPAYLVQTILGASYADVNSNLVDTTSFETAIGLERSEGIICRGFTFDAGTWWSNIEHILEHSRAMLRINASGKICYWMLEPAAPAAYEIDGKLCTLNVRAAGRMSTIRNVMGLEYMKADLSALEARSWPYTDLTSIIAYGSRPFESVLTFDLFTSPVSYSPGANDELYWRSTLIDTYEATVDWSGLQLEVGDLITATDAGLGLSDTVLAVFERRILPDSFTVGLVASCCRLTAKNWAFVDDGETADGDAFQW